MLRAGKLRVHRQIEARPAHADEGSDVPDTRIVDQYLLDLPGTSGHTLNRHTLRCPEVDPQLGAGGVREKLLRDTRKADGGDDQQSGQCANGQKAFANRALEKTPVFDKNTTGVAVCAGISAAGRFQQADAVHRCHSHGNEPARQQGDRHHVEQGAPVFAGIRLCGKV